VVYGLVIPFTPTASRNLSVGAQESSSNYVRVGCDATGGNPPVSTGQRYHYTRVVFPNGDANADGKVDVLDVFSVINYLFAGGPSPGCPTDVNGDGHVDVLDVFYLINYLFAAGPAPV
jgi:hypothetical protein